SIFADGSAGGESVRGPQERIWQNILTLSGSRLHARRGLTILPAEQGKRIDNSCLPLFRRVLFSRAFLGTCILLCLSGEVADIAIHVLLRSGWTRFELDVQPRSVPLGIASLKGPCRNSVEDKN